MPSLDLLTAVSLVIAWNVLAACVLLSIKARRFSAWTLFVAVTAFAVLVATLVAILSTPTG